MSTLMFASGAFAFGGGGHGRRTTSEKAGVDAIGIHYNGIKGSDFVVCQGDKEPWQNKCVDKCPSHLKRNTDGTCSVCANGNVYLSYYTGAECDQDVLLNRETCESNSDCSDGFMTMNGCCDESRHMCQAGFYDKTQYLCPTSDSKSCKSNSDCLSGEEFCNLIPTSFSHVSVSVDSLCDPAGFCSPGEVSVPALASAIGTCTPIGSYTESGESDKLTQLMGKVRKSDVFLNWWGAENWCKAQNMRLLDVQELGCYLTGEQPELIKAGSDILWANCCALNASKCSPYAFYRNWGVEDYSPVFLALEEVFDSSSVWTASYVVKNDLLRAFVAQMGIAQVASYDRDYNDRIYALCVAQ